MSIPESVTRGAVDLSDVQQRQEIEQARKERQEYVEAHFRARTWERNMRRAFKGILTPAARRRFLVQALVREEQDDAAA